MVARPDCKTCYTKRNMNIFDLIVYVALAWAVFNGWRRGFLLQLFSLVAVVAALYLGVLYGAEVGAMLGMEGTTAQIGGFIAIFVASLIAIAIIARLLKGVFKLAGLGVLDTLLGILFSIVKVGLGLSILFSGFEALNKDYKLASKQKVESSRWFKPVESFTDKLTPYFKELENNLLK